MADYEAARVKVRVGVRVNVGLELELGYYNCLIRTRLLGRKESRGARSRDRAREAGPPRRNTGLELGLGLALGLLCTQSHVQCLPHEAVKYEEDDYG